MMMVPDSFELATGLTPDGEVVYALRFVEGTEVVELRFVEGEVLRFAGELMDWLAPAARRAGLLPEDDG